MEYNVITVAGGEAGYIDSLVTKAKFNRPNGIVVGRQGSVFVADFGNNAIRRVTADGEVTTITGGRTTTVRQDGLATLAAFNNPRGLTFDSDGNLYVADFGNNMIRQIDTELMVSTLAGTGMKGTIEGDGQKATFQEVRDLAYHSGYIFAVDRFRIRRISRTGMASPWAGNLESGLWDGAGPAARFGTLSAIDADASGNIYVVDADNSAIRYVTPLQRVGTLAGADVVPPDGSNTMLQHPIGLAVDREGNCWVTDTGDYTIKKITPKGVITQMAGSLKAGHKDGPAHEAEFEHPSGIAVGIDGRVYVTDLATHSLRCLVPQP